MSFISAVSVTAEKVKDISITVVSPLVDITNGPSDDKHNAPIGVVEVDAAVEGVKKLGHEQIAIYAEGKCPIAQAITCALKQSQRVDEVDQSKTSDVTQVDQVNVTGCVSDTAAHYVSNFKIGIVSDGHIVSDMIVVQAIVGKDETVNTDVPVVVAQDRDTNGTVSLCIRVVKSCISCISIIGSCSHLETFPSSQVGSSDGTLVAALNIAKGIKIKVAVFEATVPSGDPLITKRCSVRLTIVEATFHGDLDNIGADPVGSNQTVHCIEVAPSHVASNLKVTVASKVVVLIGRRGDPIR